MTPILGILIGIVGTLVLLAIAIVVTMRLRGHNDAKEGYPAPGPPEKTAPDSVACHIPANPDLLTVKIGTSRDLLTTLQIDLTFLHLQIGGGADAL